MRRFLRKPASERDPLAVTMSGVRLGERALQIGSGDARSIALIAAKTGLTGTAAIVVADDHAAVRIRRAVSDAGALVDLRVVAEGRLPFDDASFDAVVIHDVSTVIEGDDRPTEWLQECRRLLRTGGRIVTIERGSPVGLRSLFAGPPSPEDLTVRAVGGGPTFKALKAAGFTTVRDLADREGLRFTEGFKTE
jgi:ubiquinone/menaquinone biosynthesis C-methylase UbiE